MARFIARVELVDLPANRDSRDIYAELHTQMELQGFKRQVDSTNVPRWLPDATYFYTGEATVEQVHEKAKAAVAAAKRKARIFVA